MEIVLGSILANIALGIVTSAVYDSVKNAYESLNRKDFNDLFLNAFDDAARELRIGVGFNNEQNIGINREYLNDILSKQIILPDRDYFSLRQDQLLTYLQDALSEPFYIENDREVEVDELLPLVIQKTKALFLKNVSSNQKLFRQTLLSFAENTNGLQEWIDNEFSVLFKELGEIKDRLEQSTGELLKDNESTRRIVTSSYTDISRRLAKIEELINPRLSETQSIFEVSSDPLPQIPSIYAPRTELSQSFCQDLRDAGWVAIVGGAGWGKTYLARAIVDSCNLDFWWISLVHKHEDEAIRHLRRQLAHIANIDDDENFTTFELGKQITQLAKAPSILVIDNIHDPIANLSLFQELRNLFQAFSDTDLKVLTTGQKALPSDLLINFSSQIISRNIPPMVSTDVEEMLDRIKAPSAIREERYIATIVAVTKGSPALINARLHYWREKNWSQDEQTLADVLLTQKPTSNIHSEQRQMLYLLDEAPRKFINRLSLLQADFDKAMAMMLAQCEPLIEDAGNILAHLRGTWIDTLDQDLFRITPLLDIVGKDNLPLEEQKRVFLSAANHHLDQKIIDIANDSLNIALYLINAQAYYDLSNYIAKITISVQNSAQASQVQWIVSLMHPTKKWADEVDLDSRIILRAAQVRILAKLEANAEIFDDDLEVLLKQSNKDKNFRALLFTYLNAGMSLINTENCIPSIRIFDRTVKLVDLFDEAFFEELDDPHLKTVESIIWFSTTQLRGLVHVTYFLEFIKQMLPDKRHRIFSAQHSIMSLCFLIDSIWIEEANNPARGWDNLISYIDNYLDDLDLISISMLKASLLRAKTVILADYLDQRDEALYLLEDANIMDVDSSTLLDLTELGFLFDGERYEDAIKIAKSLIAIDNDVYDAYRLPVNRMLAISYSALAQWTEAELQLQVTIEITDSPMFLLDRLELLGELAWVNWNQNDLEKLFENFKNLVYTLIENYDVNNPRFREVFNKTGHALGWYIAMASGIQPTLNGGEYAVPDAGRFGRLNRKIAQHTPSMGFSIALMLTQLSMLAQYTGHLEIAWSLYKEVQELIGEKEILLVDLDVVRAAPLAVQFGTPYEAIELAINAVNVTVDEMHVAPRKTELRFIYSVFSPLFVKLLTEIDSREEYSLALAEWREAIELNTRRLQEPDVWLNVVQLFEELLVDLPDDIEHKLQVFPNDIRPALNSLHHLILAEKSDNLVEKWAYQSLAAYHYLTAEEGGLGQALYNLGQYLYDVWTQIAENSGAFLNSPQLFRDELNRIHRNYGRKTVAQVLRAVQFALGEKFPQEIARFIEKYSR